MAAFVASQVVHLPLNDWLTEAGIVGSVTTRGPTLVRSALILGLSAGLCESAARAIAYGLLFRWGRADRWADALMVGLGHGGIEAMTFGAVLTAASVGTLLPLQGKDLTTLGLTGDQMVALEQQMALLGRSPWIAFAPLVERSAAMIVHGGLSVLVWSTFKRKNALYLGAAVLCHALFDSTGVWLSRSSESIWLIEGALVVLAIPLAFWAWHLRLHGESDVVPRGSRSSSLILELRLFVWAVRKELLQQWRTKRVLVIGTVFLVFGMGSPLLARFTPELVGSIEGAEQFADLIPAPTTADALGQYVKNLTQFGFILALLLGMGAVAGEKERGTATLILSKPLPRWAFVLSKFVAQSIVYALAFAISGLGAYYYTTVLFDGLAFGSFMVGNLLLTVWLLTFAAVTLLGSTVARTTGAAAGVGLAGSVTLLLLANLPRVGVLTPSGLVAWAGQLGLSNDPNPNYGALAASMVLIVLCLIGAVAALDTQEL